MSGRCASCLLAPALVLVLLSFAAGQTVTPHQARGIAPEDGFGIMRGGEPVTHDPRFPASNPESFSFPQFARAAGMIFSGTVTRIERRPAHNGQPVETVCITFRVESAIRGVPAGRDLTISQWIGLWSSGQRYHTGERVLLFLYPRSKLGLTSGVGGSFGRFSIDRWGRVLLNAQHLAAFRVDSVLGGRSRVPLSDFALAVRRAGEEE